MYKYKKLMTGLFLTIIFMSAIPLDIKAAEFPKNMLEVRTDKDKREDFSERKYDKIADIIKTISGIKFLSEEEKSVLSEDKKQLELHYRKIADIKAKIIKISAKIMKGAEGLNNKYNTIYALNMDLWNKVYSEVPDMNDSDFSNENRVKKSKSLTSDEKKKLIEDAKVLDELETKIQVFYDKVNKAEEKLNVQIDKEHALIDKIIDKNKTIWEKIFKKM